MLRTHASLGIALAVFTALTVVPTSARAQAGHDDHAGHASPYADMTDRAIKALSPEEMAGLEAGDGLGYALSAELNGMPGPKHALEMADGLALTAAQLSALEDIRLRMQTRAQALGTRIIESEAELDRRFAHGHVTPADVERLSVDIGRLRGELRAVHLEAHLETTEVLTPDQTAAYQKMRGYAG